MHLFSDKNSIVLLLVLCLGIQRLSAQWTAFNTSLTDSTKSILFNYLDNEIRITGGTSDKLELRADRADITILKIDPSKFSVKTYNAGSDTFRLFDDNKEVAVFVFQSVVLEHNVTLNHVPANGKLTRDIFLQDVLEVTIVSSSSYSRFQATILSFSITVIGSNGPAKMNCTSTVIAEEMKKRVLASEVSPYVMLTDIRVKLNNGNIVYLENYIASVE